MTHVRRYRAIILLLPLFAFTLPSYAETERHFGIQNLNPAAYSSLDSTETNTWWVTNRSINIQDEIRADKEGARMYDSPATDWIPIKVPGNILRTPGFQPNPARLVWYRKIFYLSGEVESAVTLVVGYINDRDRVYLNGKLIGATGNFGSTEPQAYDKHRLYEIPPGILEIGLNTIYVQVEGYSDKGWGINGHQTGIGPTGAVQRRDLLESFAETSLLVFYLTSGIYFLALYFRSLSFSRSRLANFEHLIFGFYLIVLTCYVFCDNQLKFELGLPWMFWKKAQYCLQYILAPGFYFFVRMFFRRSLPQGKLLRVLDKVTSAIAFGYLIAIIHVLFTNPNAFNHVEDVFIQPFLTSTLALSALGIVVYCSFKKDTDAWMMLGATTVLFASVISDVLASRGILTVRPIVIFGHFIFIAGMGFILSNRFWRLQGEVEFLNRSLEKTVEARTAELDTALKEMRQLKETQDGDYYLTSLLLNPLSGIHAPPGRAKAEIFLRQKKAFRYRKWDVELGGDLCRIDRIRLRGREYLTFLNGDAMGKSLQGAGGALVLGTVFKATIARTQTSAKLKERHPERWLKDCYDELHAVFRSFEGFMLVSAVVGLVDQATGLLYISNMEHPHSVLFRDGRSVFLDDGHGLSKFGMPETDQQFHVRAFQFKPGDVLFVGSDGRDDLILRKTDEAGERLINDDELEFLKAVEKSGGKMETLVRTLADTGDFSDDLSLIRIAFRESDGDVSELEEPEGFRELIQKGIEKMSAQQFADALQFFEEALYLQPRDEELLREMGRAYLRTNDFQRAADTFEVYIEYYPQNDEMLLYAAHSYKAIGQYAQAADYGERLRLREPRHMKNLVHLADTYRLAGDLGRAEKLLREAFLLDKENAYVKKLARILLGTANTEEWVRMGL